MANSSKIIRWGFANGGNASLFDFNEINLVPGNYYPNCGSGTPSSSSSSSSSVSSLCVTNFRTQNAQFISGVYCELLGTIPNPSDFTFLLNGLNNNTLTKSDVVNSLTTYPEFISRYKTLNLYYTYGVTPPPKAQFVSTIMPIVNSDTAVLGPVELLCPGGCANTFCPQSNNGYGATNGHMQIANNIFNSAEFVNRYGTTVKNYSNTNFVSWVMKQNDPAGDSTAVGSYYFPGIGVTEMITEMNNRGALGKAFAMAYYTSLHDIFADHAGCVNCNPTAGVVGTYENSSKFRRHMIGVVIQYLLRGVWINTRTDWTVAKNRNYLFSLPGGCNSTNPTTLVNNLKTYINTGILTTNDWGNQCCFGDFNTSSSGANVNNFLPTDLSLIVTGTLTGIQDGPTLPFTGIQNLSGFSIC